MTTTKLEIERMGYGPEAIAHDSDGKTVFVTGGVPGDTVEVETDADEARFSRAHVTKVLEASPDRVTPPCPFVDVCGGCPWAHMSYEAQLAAKRSGIVDALARLGHFSPDEAEELVAPIVAPGEPWGYRNKVELAVANQHGRAVVGMHAAGSAGVVKVPSCPLLDSKFKSVVKAVQGSMNYLAGSRDLGLERIGIRASRRTKSLRLPFGELPAPSLGRKLPRFLVTPQRSPRSCASCRRVPQRPGALPESSGYPAGAPGERSLARRPCASRHPRSFK
jgi:23S rRNA (uracil1939-C5)-methyltransferase